MENDLLPPTDWKKSALRWLFVCIGAGLIVFVLFGGMAMLGGPDAQIGFGFLFALAFVAMGFYLWQRFTLERRSAQRRRNEQRNRLRAARTLRKRRTRS